MRVVFTTLGVESLREYRQMRPVTCNRFGAVAYMLTGSHVLHATDVFDIKISVPVRGFDGKK